MKVAITISKLNASAQNESAKENTIQVIKAAINRNFLPFFFFF